jgi:hypothetical protein
MAEWTPGPWKWDVWKFNAGWRSTVLIREGQDQNHRPILGVASAACSWTPKEADACLISATPDLAAQLRLDIARFRDAARYAGHNGWSVAEEFEAFAREAEAVLRRAVPEDDAEESS